MQAAILGSRSSLSPGQGKLPLGWRPLQYFTKQGSLVTLPLISFPTSLHPSLLTLESLRENPTFRPAFQGLEVREDDLLALGLLYERSLGQR